ncbi:MAG: hypothetical protein Q8N93_10010 [Bacillota bacterium]|jgi:hypothetical protein|nr:hypothetical protein [Bacillota bacterium]MBV1769083.1 hypothetical protein [Desulforudis sp.]MDP3045713.1 hypothetical protein [Bacillota bacterium]MDP3050841.1 hypothetical protein [Eubacteriales bacterium]MDZ7609467.1 hypothetical protein [Eubacteriales bacterium]
MNLIDHFLFFVIGIDHFRFIDWAGIFIFGHTPTNLPEAVFAQVGQLFFSGLVGIFFVYLLPQVTSRYYLVKGVIYAQFVWFGSYALSILFQVPGLRTISLESAVSDLIGSLVYGLVLAWVLRLIDKRVGV